MTQRPKILLSGFDAFGKLHRNTSQAIVEAITATQTSGSILYSAILPTSYERSFVTLSALITELQPDFIVMLGVASSSQDIRIEQQAHNRLSTKIEDNDAYVPQTPYISASACDVLHTAVDTKKLQATLANQKPHCVISEDCGDYVCNFLYYNVLSDIKEKQLSSKALFVHVPHILDGRLNEQSELDSLTKSIKHILLTFTE